MNLGRARSLALVVALTSCSTETLVVATLDASAGEAGEPSAPYGGGIAGDEFGGVGGAELGGGDGAELGGTTAAHGGGASGTGGTGLMTELQGDPTTSVCACVGSASFVCSADGVTYDSSCGSACDRVVIACLHACPCTDGTGEGGASSSTEWVDERCFDRSLCPSGSLCITSDGTGLSRPCAP
jgi:hypothetical protein